MGSLVPVLASTLLTQGVAFAAQEGQRRQGEKQLKQEQALRERQNAQSAALEKERLALDTKNTEAERKSALKRAVSRQRAQFGAQGVGASGGSSQAVLLGFFDESEDEREKREAMDNIRSRAIDQGLSQQSAINVLQRTQLAEKNRLRSLSTITDLV